jgi:hypothetical protein
MADGTADLVRLLADPTASPLALMRAFTSRFGVEWLTWDYTALRMTLERELHVQVSPQTMSKAVGGAAIAVSDTFWTDWEHFHFLVQALNGRIPDFKNHQELSVGLMMRAVLVAQAIRKELGKLVETVPFSEEVARYVAAQALQAGVWYLPPPLEFATRHASGLSYRCKDCGNTSPVFVDDGLCDVCVHRFDTSQLGRWTPDPEELAKGRGSSIEYFEKNPTGPIVRRLQELHDHPGRTLQENQTDICTGKILAAVEYARQGQSGESAW